MEVFWQGPTFHHTVGEVRLGKMKSTPGQNRDVIQTTEAGSFAAWRQDSES